MSKYLPLSIKIKQVLQLHFFYSGLHAKQYFGIIFAKQALYILSDAIHM